MTLARVLDGRPLRAALIDAGEAWTQAALARALGVSPQRVHGWASGKNKVPQAKARELVAVFVRAGAVPPRFLGLAGPERHACESCGQALP